MKCGSAVFLVLGTLVLAGSPLRAQFGVPRGGEEAARYGWLPTLEAGTAEARQSGKPLLVVLRCVP
jgi:hypothetical protein